MTNAELNQLKQRYVASGAASPSEQFAARGENALLWDAEGNRIIDFAGGIGVLNLGHRHPKVVEAVKAQLDQLMHTCQTVISYAPYVKLAEKLCQLTPVRGEAKTMLVNSGAEALENAVKVARAATGRSGIICFDGSFHGRSFMTLAMTGKVLPYKNDFGPMPGDVFRAPFPVPYHGISEEDSLKALKTVFKTDIAPHRTAAIVIEPIQGEGGFYAASPSFLKALREICDEHGILLIVDEVQSGFARTGKLFALEHSGIEADIMTMAKSLADGMPLSAVVGTGSVMDASGPNSLGGTYSGNPLACAAALAVIEAIEEEDILARSRTLGDKLAKRMAEWQQEFEAVDNPRNVGSMAAFELVADKSSRTPAPELAAALCKKTKEKGLILLACGFWGNSIRFLMPITIEDELLEEGLDIVEASLKELVGQPATA
ncbi:4-aminobutyrate--2-oxoglutarate transaminase [Halomonas sp. KAO]|uniref:4-aminobutyrate--2-oxoglutarate transaminase n=1 Tax=unclassified Halomonas TaxID=2609666 RepID=UPI00189DC91B|nr:MULTISPECIES: 4-aminobutyrate--2-oxoglutarate transaminase [unclassified Halomonas]MBF7052105.1 4-aminobutyrate--2-oxoglutarate transaminase [Halomonas sp. KAO]MDT0500301.1 4-aminobutyrate--2-oxoglutarate transaminase [Halomonas sp. PAR7]MDT0511203.1 4-aminobutyrate--2-oxoglutarate transaminase [Halomonas sp. LES1]MDT0590508.1 4-aminobutyrate--2-oxoglutarate transaminase [Halomonas sp. PAR8]